MSSGGLAAFLAHYIYIYFFIAMFSQTAVILAALREEEATDDSTGEGRSQEHHRCILNAGVTSFDLPTNLLTVKARVEERQELFL